jgi:hypothetical protein
MFPPRHRQARPDRELSMPSTRDAEEAMSGT